MREDRRLDDKGRCCGRKPIFYRGGAWNSPPQAPMHYCTRCDREYGPDGVQRESRAWTMINGEWRETGSIGVDGL